MGSTKQRTGDRVGYVRVSTIDQNTERQLDGVQVDRLYTDKASGQDANRPELAKALAYLREGDTLVVHSMDRLARNLLDLQHIVGDLTSRGVTVEFVKEGQTYRRDERDPMRMLMLQILGAVAQFERAMISERQREGIALAKQRKAYKGRKATLNTKQAQELRTMAEQSIPKAEIARHFGISRETVYQYLRKAA
jgi:DNA invertase Pin-like site-specific DNA recombinase